MATADRRNKYKVSKVCELLEISKKTLYSLEARGLIPPVPRDWRGWRTYDKSHLEAVRKYQESKTKRSTQEE